MSKTMCIRFIIAVLLTCHQCVIAAQGTFFRIAESGVATPLEITLCLNGRGPLTCQRYVVNHQILDISTIVPNHVYPAVGIKVNTPGYIAVDGCTYINNGYCIFSTNDTTTATVVINPVNNMPDPGDVSISVSGSPLGLTVNGPAGTLTITNLSSTIAALNITSSFTGTALAGKVQETGNTCQHVPPNGHCALTFTPGSSTALPTRFIIGGINTRPITAIISIDPAEVAEITVSGSPLSLETNDSVRSLTITNTSNFITATNIASNFTTTALAGNVTETGNTCGSLAPRASCTLTFTPGATAVDETEFPIQGTNTNTINATISITAPANAEIKVSNSPLILNTNGPTGTLTITNLSNTVTAINIASDFTGTGLVGKVTETGNTCGSVAPGNSCTLTYTPGATPVAQTTFTINGTNTDGILAAIKIDSLSIGTDFGGGKVGCLTSTGGIKNLIVANADTTTSLVWTNKNVATGAISQTDGMTNTTKIVAFIGTSPAFAAPHCNDYLVDSEGNTPCQPGFTCYSDWYLPATNELLCLEGNQGAIGGFFNELYWTSTEANKNSARAVSFQNGSTPNKSKDSSILNVRCVRSFTP